MLSIVELIAGVSILLASGFILIFIKETVLHQTNDSSSKLELESSKNKKSFIPINMDLITEGDVKKDAEKGREKRKKLEAFRLRNQFYQIK